MIDLSIFKVRVDRFAPRDRVWQRKLEFGDRFRISIGAPTREDGFGAAYNRFELGVGWCPYNLRFSLVVLALEVSWYESSGVKRCS